MGLRLIWETAEWDPIPGVDGDDDEEWGFDDENLSEVSTPYSICCLKPDSDKLTA